MTRALRILAWVLAPIAVGPALAQAACDIGFTITPRYDTSPRALEIEMRFAAGQRESSFLRVATGWAGVNDFHAAFGDWRGEVAGRSDSVRIEPADLPNRWRVLHPPGGEVRVSFRVRASLADPDDGKPQPQEQLYRGQLGADWFQFFGYAVFPSLEHWDDRTRPVQCVAVLQPATAHAAAFGTYLDRRGPRVEFTLQSSPAELRHAFFGGGTGWRIARRALDGGSLSLALRGKFNVGDDAFADGVAGIVDGQRKFWGGSVRLQTQWVVLTPNFGANLGGTWVTRAAVLHAGGNNDPAGGLGFLVAHENLHQWIPERLGAHTQTADGYWFSEGFTNYFTHRLLLAGGAWSLERYAAELTQVWRRYWRSPNRNVGVAQIAPRFFSDRDAGQQLYQRGEFLAMRWDRALRAGGHEGLDRIVRALAQSRPAAPDSDPAWQRTLAALRPLLADLADNDVEIYVRRGGSVPVEPDLAGPCFMLGWRELPRWTPGFDLDSMSERTARGVVVDGPAYAAGLRDGMRLTGWSIHGGDVTRPIELRVRIDAEERWIRFLPVDGSRESLPWVSVRAGAADDAACRAWQRRVS